MALRISTLIFCLLAALYMAYDANRGEEVDALRVARLEGADMARGIAATRDEAAGQARAEIAAPSRQQAEHAGDAVLQALISAAERDLVRQPQQALTFSERALEHAKGTGEPALRAKAYALHARVLSRLGRGVEARQAARLAVDLSELAAAASAAPDMGAILLALAESHAAAGSLGKAFVAYGDAEAAFVRAGEQAGAIEARLGAAQLFLDSGDPARAVEKLDTVEAVRDQLSDLQLARASLVRARALTAAGEPRAALAALGGVEHLYSADETPTLFAERTLALGDARRALGEDASAEANYRNASVVAENLGAGGVAAEARLRLAAYALTRGDIEAAASNLAAFERLQASVQSSRLGGEAQRVRAGIKAAQGDFAAAYEMLLVGLEAFERSDARRSRDGVAILADALDQREREVRQARSEMAALARSVLAHEATLRDGAYASLTVLCFLVLGVALLYWRAREASEAANDRAVQLERARNALQRANAAKSDLLAMASHELRTPLNGIVGMSASLRGKANLAADRDALAAIEGQAERLASLVSDMVTLAEAADSELKLKARPFLLQAFLEDVAAAWRPQFVAKGLAFSADIVGDAPATLLGDAQRWRQVADNLLSNAFKFTESGGGRITLSGVQLGDLFNLTLTVSDTGPGIDAAKRSRLLEPFTQNEEGRTRRHEGAGLGLAVCATLAKAMGGRLEIDSLPGRGSSFRFTAPMKVGVNRSLSRRIDEGARGDSPIRLLIAEDNLVNQLVLRELLSDAGVQFDMAGNGAEAVELASVKRYDAVIMDIRMPVMDGMEAARRIRRLPGPMAKAPIVALTADATGDVRDEALAAGMNEFLAKPVRREQLQRLLDDLETSALSGEDDRAAPNREPGESAKRGPAPAAEDDRAA